MFVLNTINIVKCLNIPAQPSSQQSIELNHFNTLHICLPHEYKMFLTYTTAFGHQTKQTLFIDSNQTATINVLNDPIKNNSCIQSCLYSAVSKEAVDIRLPILVQCLVCKQSCCSDSQAAGKHSFALGEARSDFLGLLLFLSTSKSSAETVIRLIEGKS